MGLGKGSGQHGKAMQCFMAIWFNGTMPNAGGALICGLAKSSPKFLCHHFAHAPLHCTRILFLTRYALYEYDCWPLSLLIFGLYTPPLMIIGWIMGRHAPPRGVQNSFVSFLKELGNKQNATLQSYAM